jgi:hypothetical protein
MTKNDADRSLRMLCFVFAACAGSAVHAASSACHEASNAIPIRQEQAEAGSDFARRIESLSERDRQLAIRASLLAGNVPSFLRAAVPVQLRGRLADGMLARVTLCVLPDYLAIGSNADYLLIPMGLDTALAVASAFGFTLPTRRIVDGIYAQAMVQLAPVPLQSGSQMRSVDYVVRHNSIIAAQRGSANAPLGALTAGDKKELVLTPRLWSDPGRVAIYGWHRGVGRPIQPLSTVHGARYADYSHGVRLISTRVFVDGRPASIFDVLGDQRLAPMLSDEGTITSPEALLAASAAAPPQGSQ